MEAEVPPTVMPELAVDFSATELYADLKGKEAAQAADVVFNTPTSGRWVQKKAEEVVDQITNPLLVEGDPCEQTVPPVIIGLITIAAGVLVAYGTYRLVKRLF